MLVSVTVSSSVTVVSPGITICNNHRQHACTQSPDQKLPTVIGISFVLVKVIVVGVYGHGFGFVIVTYRVFVTILFESHFVFVTYLVHLYLVTYLVTYLRCSP